MSWGGAWLGESSLRLGCSSAYPPGATTLSSQQWTQKAPPPEGSEVSSSYFLSSFVVLYKEGAVVTVAEF